MPACQRAACSKQDRSRLHLTVQMKEGCRAKEGSGSGAHVKTEQVMAMPRPPVFHHFSSPSRSLKLGASLILHPTRKGAQEHVAGTQQTVAEQAVEPSSSTFDSAHTSDAQAASAERVSDNETLKKIPLKVTVHWGRSEEYIESIILISAASWQDCAAKSSCPLFGHRTRVKRQNVTQGSALSSADLFGGASWPATTTRAKCCRARAQARPVVLGWSLRGPTTHRTAT